MNLSITANGTIALSKGFNASLVMTTNSSSAPDEYIQPLYLTIWRSEVMAYYKYSIFGVIIFISFFGNSLIMVTVLLTDRLKSVTNYFLFNMATSDLLVSVIVMPIHMVFWFDQSIMTARLTCKIVPFIQGTTICCTIYTLMVIALDRYKVILQPLRTRIHKNHCYMVILSIWCAAMLTVSPTLFVYRVGPHPPTGTQRCDEYGWSDKKKIEFTYTLMVLTYFLPLSLFSYTYGKIFIRLWFRDIPGIKDMPSCVQLRMRKKFVRRKKLVRMLIAVVVTFMLCHLPQNIINFLWYTGESVGWEAPEYMEIIAFHSEILLYMNAPLNPIVYGLLHGRIKEAAIGILRSAFCCSKRKKFYGSYPRSTHISLMSSQATCKYKSTTMDRSHTTSRGDREV